MKEPLGDFGVETRASAGKGTFARGALLALPFSLAVWLALYLTF